MRDSGRSWAIQAEVKPLFSEKRKGRVTERPSRECLGEEGRGHFLQQTARRQPKAFLSQAVIGF